MDEVIEDVVEEVIEVIEDTPEMVVDATNEETVSDKEIEYQNRMKELWSKEVAIELRMEGLSDFSEFFLVEESNRDSLEQKIKTFKQILSKRDLNDGFVPDGHRSTEQFSLAEKNRDSRAMISSKISAFFK